MRPAGFWHSLGLLLATELVSTWRRFSRHPRNLVLGALIGGSVAVLLAGGAAGIMLLDPEAVLDYLPTSFAMPPLEQSATVFFLAIQLVACSSIAEPILRRLYYDADSVEALTTPVSPSALLVARWLVASAPRLSITLGVSTLLFVAVLRLALVRPATIVLGLVLMALLTLTVAALVAVAVIAMMAWLPPRLTRLLAPALSVVVAVLEIWLRTWPAGTPVLSYLPAEVATRALVAFHLDSSVMAMAGIAVLACYSVVATLLLVGWAPGGYRSSYERGSTIALGRRHSRSAHIPMVGGSVPAIAFVALLTLWRAPRRWSNGSISLVVAAMHMSSFWLTHPPQIGHPGEMTGLIWALIFASTGIGYTLVGRMPSDVPVQVLRTLPVAPSILAGTWVLLAAGPGIVLSATTLALARHVIGFSLIVQAQSLTIIATVIVSLAAIHVSNAYIPGLLGDDPSIRLRPLTCMAGAFALAGLLVTDWPTEQIAWFAGLLALCVLLPSLLIGVRAELAVATRRLQHADLGAQAE